MDILQDERVLELVNSFGSRRFGPADIATLGSVVEELVDSSDDVSLYTLWCAMTEASLQADRAARRRPAADWVLDNTIAVGKAFRESLMGPIHRLSPAHARELSRRARARVRLGLGDLRSNHQGGAP